MLPRHPCKVHLIIHPGVVMTHLTHHLTLSNTFLRLPALQGTPPQRCPALGGRPASRSPPPSSPYACGPIFHQDIYFPRVLHILVRFLSVFCLVDAFFTNHLSPAYTFRPHSLTLFWPVPGWFAGLICSPETACKADQSSVSNFAFCVPSSHSTHLMDYCLFCIIRVSISTTGRPHPIP